MKALFYISIFIITILSCTKTEVTSTMFLSGEVIAKSSGTKSVVKFGKLTDIDGNVYKTIQIGNQIWMAENLRVSKYRNGDPIDNITDNSLWSPAPNGAWCNYQNNPSFDMPYGKLYNWKAVNDPRGLAPKGWHIPSDAEWTILTDNLGGVNVAGGKLKDSGYVFWVAPNSEATNSSRFSGMPSGVRGELDGGFAFLGQFCWIWSSDEYDANNAIARCLYYLHGAFAPNNYDKRYGFAVRCIKD